MKDDKETTQFVNVLFFQDECICVSVYPVRARVFLFNVGEAGSFFSCLSQV